MSNWKIITNYPNYAVSDTGEVKSLPRKNGAGTRVVERVLKQDIGKKGYCRVTLCNKQGTKKCLVHRLVAEAFIPNSSSKDFVNHIDNNPSNNTVSNLEWCTHSENMVHAIKQNRLQNTHLKASKARAEKFQKETENYFVYSMGTRFLKAYMKDKKRYIQFICPTCLNETEVRADRIDNPSTKECKACTRKTAGKKIWITRRKQDEDIV